MSDKGRDPEIVFNEAVRHLRYDGLHISDLSHEALSLCGRASLRDLETLIEAYREWIDATIYKPEDKEQ